MAVPPSRRNAGKIDIANKERKIREELKAREDKKNEKPISEEEHNKRMELLKNLGFIKQE
jgi:hypothetical protein